MRPPDMTDAFLARVASLMLAASDAPSVWYTDELRLMAGEWLGGSLKGDASIGLTGAESEKGSRRPIVDGVPGVRALLAPAMYGGGAVPAVPAVAFDADRPTPTAAAPAIIWPMLGG